MDKIPLGTMCLLLPAEDGSGARFYGSAFTVIGHEYPDECDAPISRLEWEAGNYHTLKVTENTCMGTKRKYLLPISPDDDAESEEYSAPIVAQMH